MTVKLGSNAKVSLTKLINYYVEANPDVFSGASVAILNREGTPIYSHATGNIGAETDEPLTTDSMLWLASGTKMIGTIIVLQAVERNIVNLDDSDIVEKYCPELRSIPILKDASADGQITLVPKKNKITLRQLITHTSGLGYGIFNRSVRKYAGLVGFDEFAGNANSLNHPLMCEPGTQWRYGCGIDWACILVSRIAQKSVDDLLREHLLNPLGAKDVTFRPNEEQRSRVMRMNGVNEVGKLVEKRQKCYGFLDPDPAIRAQAIDMAGSGLFAAPQEYLKIMAAILNDGVSAQTGERILTSATIKELFTDQFPEVLHDADFTPFTTLDPHKIEVPKFFPMTGVPPKNWGLSWFLNSKPYSTGRSANSAYWPGFSNIHYWVDPTAGVTGFVGCHLDQFPHPKIWKLFGEVETQVYSFINADKLKT